LRIGLASGLGDHALIIEGEIGAAPKAQTLAGPTLSVFAMFAWVIPSTLVSPPRL
jgi:hypothetical protein